MLGETGALSAKVHSLPVAQTRNSPVKHIWTSNLKKQSWLRRNSYQFSKLAMDEERIYAGVEKGYFYGIRKKDGRKVWTFRTQGAVYSQPAVDEENVYFGDAKGYVYALEKKSGKLIWNAFVDAPIHSSPLILKDQIYFVSLTKQLSNFNKNTGALLWQTPPLQPDRVFTVVGSANPVLSGGFILVGFADGALVAYQPENGQIHWVKQLGDRSAMLHDVDATAWVADDRLYLPTADGNLYALNGKDGKIIWSAPMGGVNNPILSGDRLYLTAQGALYALEAQQGKVLWEQDLGVPEISTPGLLGKFLAVAATRGKMYFVDREAGDVYYSRYLPKGSYSEPVVQGNRMYLLSNKGRLFCFELKRTD